LYFEIYNPNHRRLDHPPDERDFKKDYKINVQDQSKSIVHKLDRKAEGEEVTFTKNKSANSNIYGGGGWVI